MSDVWAIDLLPVVKKQPPGQAGASITFSDAQDALIVSMREERRRSWGEIKRITITLSAGIAP